MNSYRFRGINQGKHSAYANLIRFCEPMKQGLQLLFTGSLPLQVTTLMGRTTASSGNLLLSFFACFKFQNSLLPGLNQLRPAPYRFPHSG